MRGADQDEIESYTNQGRILSHNISVKDCVLSQLFISRNAYEQADHLDGEVIGREPNREVRQRNRAV